MATKPQRQRRREATLSSLNVAIEALNLIKEATSITPSPAVFGTVSVLLTIIRDSMANKTDYIELGLTCADVCRALDRGMDGRRLDEFNRSVVEAIEQLTTTVAEIQGNIAEKGGRNLFSRLVHARNDKEVVAAWRSDLNRVLHVFNTELAINTHVLVADIHRNALTGQEGTDTRHNSSRARIPPGESPPPPPRTCFGRDGLIEKIVGLAENFTPIALIGAGGIGKTTIALKVLHHNRIKQRFGDNRRFIRCDKFPTSLTHLLARLSKVIGAGVENPEDLTPLRPFLSSTEMILFLDNAESILDPQGTDAQEIYGVVEELSRFGNICLCITSRISTIPSCHETLDIPTLSMDAARDTFYCVHKNGERSDLIDRILGQLDFHPLSVALLGTTAHHNTWNNNRLAREWDTHRTQMLRADHNESLAATIELSLASPMFRELGPDARDLLGVVAFFPQGVDEVNLDWLFPTRTTLKRLFSVASDRKSTFDKFCTLSLTYRSNGLVTMLAPLRDYLCPKDPRSSPLLPTIKKRYFRRLSVFINPDKPDFEKGRWITSEDMNIEHLLDVFTTIDANSGEVWATCAYFMQHLCWHKRRLVTLGPKIEGLPDGHPSKPQCLFDLSRLVGLVGNHVEAKRLLTHTLVLWRERGNNFQVAEMLRFLSIANRMLGLHEEAIQQTKEALGIYGQLNSILGQVWSLQQLAWLLHQDGLLDAAEEAASQTINLCGGEDQFVVCDCYRILGRISYSRGETRKAIDHFEAALRIASPSSWHDQLFWNHYDLAELFFKEGRFDDAHASAERATSHAINDPYRLGRAMQLRASFWYQQRRFEEAKSEALRAANVYERFGATRELGNCRSLLCDIEEGMREPATSVCGPGHHPASSFVRTLPRAAQPAPGQRPDS